MIIPLFALQYVLPSPRPAGHCLRCPTADPPLATIQTVSRHGRPWVIARFTIQLIISMEGGVFVVVILQVVIPATVQNIRIIAAVQCVIALAAIEVIPAMG